MRNARSLSLMAAFGMGWSLAGSTAAAAQSYYGDWWHELFEPSQLVDTDWPRHFRLGALVGFNLKATFGMSGQFAVAGSNPGVPGVPGQNHDYDDGYVRLDATGNDGGLTWNWGYENSSQLVGQRLYFHSTQSFTASAGATVSANPQAGFDSAYGQKLFPLWGGALGWEVGFGVLPIQISDRQPVFASATRTVHSFDVAGIEVLPNAPYQGGFIGPSVAIGDRAAAETSDAVTALLTGSHTLDVVLYNLRIGPTLQWELHPRLALAVSAGAAFGIVSGNLKYDETLVFSDSSTAINQGQVGDTEAVYGGYVAGALIYHAVKHGDLYLGLQYMPLSSVTMSGAGREASLNLSGGLYISAGLSWPF